jgi:uncharacterized protein (TIGR00369 family)
MVIGQEMSFDDPGNVCFGCSPHNERGLQLTFTHVGPGRVECEYRAPDHTCGAPGVVHGGIQAVLLDEAIGFAIHAHDADESNAIQPVVTMEFDLRYRRPVTAGASLTLRGEVVRAHGRDYLAVAEILDADGEVLTSATARWRRLG